MYSSIILALHRGMWPREQVKAKTRSRATQPNHEINGQHLPEGTASYFMQSVIQGGGITIVYIGLNFYFSYLPLRSLSIWGSMSFFNSEYTLISSNLDSFPWLYFLFLEHRLEFLKSIFWSGSLIYFHFFPQISVFCSRSSNILSL